MSKAKKKYVEKNIVVQEPDENIESVTTTTDSEPVVSVGEPPIYSLEGLTRLVDALNVRLEDVERELVTLEGDLDSHTLHLPTPGPSTTPRRHDTYEVKEDGEKLARIAKQLWGISGRYVEIAALNSITDATELKKGQILKLPK